MMLGNIFQQFYTMADTMIVGRVVGVEALAAVGAGDWLVWLVLGIMTGIHTHRAFRFLYRSTMEQGKRKI